MKLQRLIAVFLFPMLLGYNLSREITTARKNEEYRIRCYKDLSNIYQLMTLTSEYKERCFKLLSLAKFFQEEYHKLDIKYKAVPKKYHHGRNR